MEVKKILGDYYKRFPEDLGKYGILDQQIAKGEDLISRKNFNGHVTASGLILCPKGERALMIFHNRLEMYIQPGGHLEEEDTSLIEAAIREVKEETGLEEFSLDEYFKMLKTPLLVDTHKIPANKKNGEDEHYHHDFMYLFKANSTDYTLQIDEVSDAKWVDLDELIDLDDAVGKAVRRLKQITDLQHKT